MPNGKKDVVTPVVDQTTTPPASVEEKKDPVTPTIDYKKLYEEIKASDEAKANQLKQAEHTIVTLKKGKKKDESIDEDDSADVPTIDIEGIRNQIVEEARKDLEKSRYETVSETVDDIIAGMSENPDEQKLIKYQYEKKIVKSGTSRKDIMNDLTSAFVLANKERFYTENDELKKSLISKQTISKPSVSGQSGVHDESVKLSPDEEKWVDSAVARTGRPREEVVKKLLSNK